MLFILLKKTQGVDIILNFLHSLHSLVKQNISWVILLSPCSFFECFEGIVDLSLHSLNFWWFFFFHKTIKWLYFSLLSSLDLPLMILFMLVPLWSKYLLPPLLLKEKVNANSVRLQPELMIFHHSLSYNLDSF